MSSDDGLEELVFRRANVLEATLEEPLAKPAIVDRTEVARSTVDRAIAELEDWDLVERVGSEYRATAAGRHLHRRHSEFAADAAAAHDAREVLVALDPDEYLPPAVLRGAEVHVRDPSMPETVVKRGMELVRVADHFRLCSRVQLDIYQEVTKDLLVNDELTVESIYDEGRWSVFREQYPERFERVRESGNLSAHLSDSLPSYTLGIAETPDGSVMLVATHGDCGVRGGLVNDAPDAVAWAEARLDELRTDAEQLVSGARDATSDEGAVESN